MIYWIIVLSGILLDQGTKYIVRTVMIEHQSIPIINNIFHLTFVMNDGAAFSILRGHKTFFIIVTILALAAVFFIFTKTVKEEKVLRVGLCLIAAGAIGNVLDRIRFDAVVDFFDFRIWPIFNIADMMIVGAMILLAWYILFSKSKTKDDK